MKKIIVITTLLLLTSVSKAGVNYDSEQIQEGVVSYKNIKAEFAGVKMSLLSTKSSARNFCKMLDHDGVWSSERRLGYNAFVIKENTKITNLTIEDITINSRGDIEGVHSKITCFDNEAPVTIEFNESK